MPTPTTLRISHNVAESNPFQVTVIPWRNKWVDGKGWQKSFARKGAIASYPAGTITPCQDNRRSREEREQPGALCAPHTGLLIVECDHEEEFPELGLLPTVRSSRGYHYWIDARGIPAADWPTQGPITGGDVKSNGFVPMPGCDHWSGVKYEAVNSELNTATPELMSKLRQLRAEEDSQLKHTRAGGGGSGTFGHGHNALGCRLTFGWAREGLDKEEARALWYETEVGQHGCEDFDFLFDSAVAKIEEIPEWNPAPERASAETISSGWTGDPLEDMPEWAREDSSLTCSNTVAVTSIDRDTSQLLSDSYAISAPRPPVMTPKQIRQQRKAEMHHFDPAVEKKARERSQKTWRGAPSGCWAFYDWLMYLHEQETSAEEIHAWVQKQPRSKEFLAWLVRSGLIFQDKDIYLPIPDSRGKCKHLAKDCREHQNKCCPCVSYPGWEPEYGDTQGRPKWDGDEARRILLDLVIADIENRQQRTCRQYAALMNLPGFRKEYGFVSKAMVARWMKELRGYRRERVPGTSKQFVWLYDNRLARIHVAEPGYAYRDCRGKHRFWANHPDRYALGPEISEEMERFYEKYSKKVACLT